MRDPLALALAGGLGRGNPAAILLAEVVGDVADLEALVGEEVRQRVQAPHHVRALPGVGGHGRLGLDVVEGFVGDVHLHAGGLGEGLDDLQELRVLGFHEALPAQHVDRGVRLGLEGHGLCPGLGEVEQPGGAGDAQRGAALDHSTTINVEHVGFLPGGFWNRRGIEARPAFQERPRGGAARPRNSGQALARSRRRRVDQLGIGSDHDRLARAGRDALAEHADELLPADLRDHLRLRAGRLHHHDLGRPGRSGSRWMCSGRMP